MPAQEIKDLKDQLSTMASEMAEMKVLLEDQITNQPHQAIQATGANTTVNQIQHQEVRNSVSNEYKQENHISNQVTVNVFGQEKVDHITAPQIYRLLMGAKDASEPAIQALLNAALVVFSDPEKPENLTCYLPNKKTSDALVHEASGWQIKPIETVLSPMIQKSLDVLFLKQPHGHEAGLPDKPDIAGCGEVLKKVMELETDSVLSKKASASHGPLRAVLVRNKDALTKANGGTPPTAGEG